MSLLLSDCVNKIVVSEDGLQILTVGIQGPPGTPGAPGFDPSNLTPNRIVYFDGTTMQSAPMVHDPVQTVQFIIPTGDDVGLAIVGTVGQTNPLQAWLSSAPGGGPAYVDALGRFVGDGSLLTNLPGGTDSGNSLTGQWQFSTNTTIADPGNGFFRVNDADISSATQLAIANATMGGADSGNALTALQTGDIIYIQDKTDSTIWIRFTISATPTQHAGWFQIPITAVSGSGTTPTDGEICLFHFSQSGGGGGGGPIDPNVAYTNQANVFTQPQTVNTASHPNDVVLGGPVYLLNAQGNFIVGENGRGRIYTSGDGLVIQCGAFNSITIATSLDGFKVVDGGNQPDYLLAGFPFSPSTGAGVALKIRQCTVLDATQTANLTEWLDKNDVLKAWVDKDGKFAGDGSLLTNIAAGALPATVAYTNVANTFNPGPQKIITGGVGGNKGLIIQAVAGQTANIQEWQVFSGAAVAWVDKDGKFHGDGSGLTNIAAGALPATVAYTDDDNFFTRPQTVVAGAINTGLTVKASTGQSADLQQWQDNFGGPLASVNFLGQFVGDGSQLTNLPINNSLIAYWKYSTNTTMGDPGNGFWRANAATPITATQLAFSKTASDSLDFGNVFKTLAVGDQIYIQDKANSANYVRYNVTAVPTDNTTWFQVAVSVAGGAGAAPASSTSCLVQFSQTSGATPSLPATVAYTDVANIFTVAQTFATAAAVVPVTVKGAASQTANLQEWQNSAGTVKSAMDKDGLGFVLPATFNLAISAPATTGSNKTNPLILPFAGKIVKAQAACKTAPTGAALICDLNKNGSTLWTTQANRIQIAAGATTGSQTTFNITSVAAGDLLTIDIDQIGSTFAGQDVTVVLTILAQNQ